MVRRKVEDPGRCKGNCKVTNATLALAQSPGGARLQQRYQSECRETDSGEPVAGGCEKLVAELRQRIARGRSPWLHRTLGLALLQHVCAVAVPAGQPCKSAILVGENGIPETRANNRNPLVNVMNAVVSGFRNPQYNRSIGSRIPWNAHGLGMAVDVDHNRLVIPGKSAREMACIVKWAGDKVPGVRRSAAELRVNHNRALCSDRNVDHVHIDVAQGPYPTDSSQSGGNGN